MSFQGQVLGLSVSVRCLRVESGLGFRVSCQS